MTTRDYICASYNKFSDKYNIDIAWVIRMEWNGPRNKNWLGFYLSKPKPLIELNYPALSKLPEKETDITVIHELAHHLTVKKFGEKARIHGKEFKKIYTDMLIENELLQKTITRRPHEL
jgi:predicted SprT family Zn-dependent metalloprotease